MIFWPPHARAPCAYMSMNVLVHTSHIKQDGWHTRKDCQGCPLVYTHEQTHVQQKEKREFGNPKSTQEEPCRMTLPQAVEPPKAGRDLTPSRNLDLGHPGPRTMTKYISENSAGKHQTFGHHIK